MSTLIASKDEPSMELTSTDVSNLLAEVGFHPIRDGQSRVKGVSSFDQSEPDSITFWKWESVPSTEQVEGLAPGVLVLALPNVAGELSRAGMTTIGVEDPRAAFAVVSEYFNPTAVHTGIHPTAIVDPAAQVDASASIGAGSVIGAKCVIGPRTRIGHYCVIHDSVSIDADVSIGDLTVVGAAGFGYVTLPSGSTVLIPHIGSVRIHRGAHIGSHVAIDRGTINDTVIGESVRIDNLVHIAHNVQIGPHAMVIAGAEVSGGVVIGEKAWIAPQASIREQVVIGAESVVGIGSTVLRDVRPGVTVAGVPARELSAGP